MTAIDRTAGLQAIKTTVIVCSIFLNFATAQAQDLLDYGRYTLQQVPEGALRLDTRTGEVSLCSKRDASWSCRLLPDERAGGTPAVQLPSSTRLGGITLTSHEISPGATIQNEHVYRGFGCNGANISPELRWSDAPSGTKSFAVTLYDPDAPTGSGWWHWMIINIPVTSTFLPRNAGDPKMGLAPPGSIQIRTDFGAAGYGGPCPPKGSKPHRYVFTVFAVDVDKVPVDETSSAALVGFNLNSHTLAKATLIGFYGRER